MSSSSYRVYEQRIHTVANYIEQHLDAPFSLDTLADVAGFSKYHFHRVFKGFMHESIGDYVQRVRFEQICHALVYRDDLNITDIAMRFGFSDSAVFSRAFKNYMGISPSVYKQSKNCKAIPKANVYTEDVSAIATQCRVTVEQVDAQRVIYVRDIGSYESLKKTFADYVGLLFGYAQEHGLLNHKTRLLAMYHNSPEFGDKDHMRTSIAMTVDDTVTVNDERIGIMTIPSGLTASFEFMLLPEEFGLAWSYIYGEWLINSGYFPGQSFPYEVYLNNPSEHPEGKSHVMIYVPIEPIA